MNTLALPALGRLVQSGKTATHQERSTESAVIWSTPAEWLPAPVVYSTTSVFLNLGSMEVGKPYPVRLGEHQVVAVKSADGSVRFFAIPD